MILGIDPGTHSVGWAFVENGDIFQSGSFFQKHGDAIVRSVAIANCFVDMIKNKDITPDHVVIEDQYVYRNAKSTIILSRAVGMLEYVFFQNFNCIPNLISPTQVYKVLPFNAVKMKRKEYHKKVVEHVYKTYNIELSSVDEAFAILLALAFEKEAQS